MGTSIWLMADRASSRATDPANDPANGTSSSSTFEGRWVNTIVFSRPIRFASRAAVSADSPCRSPTPKNTTPSASGEAPYRRANQ